LVLLNLTVLVEELHRLSALFVEVELVLQPKMSLGPNVLNISLLVDYHPEFLFWEAGWSFFIISIGLFVHENDSDGNGVPVDVEFIILWLVLADH
jgi:hypothetical protein